jgi:hypothetical protein
MAGHGQECTHALEWPQCTDYPGQGSYALETMILLAQDEPPKVRTAGNQPFELLPTEAVKRTTGAGFDAAAGQVAQSNSDDLAWKHKVQNMAPPVAVYVLRSQNTRAEPPDMMSPSAGR